MNIFEEFMSTYGMTILYTVVTAIFGYLGVIAKKLVTKYLNDKTKKEVARTCVQAVEQIYKDLHGDEKLNKAVEAAAGMLTEKGIKVTGLELQMLIESALCEFNDAFYKTADTATQTTNEAGFNATFKNEDEAE